MYTFGIAKYNIAKNRFTKYYGEKSSYGTGRCCAVDKKNDKQNQIDRTIVFFGSFGFETTNTVGSTVQVMFSKFTSKEKKMKI